MKQEIVPKSSDIFYFQNVSIRFIILKIMGLKLITFLLPYMVRGTQSFKFSIFSNKYFQILQKVNRFWTFINVQNQKPKSRFQKKMYKKAFVTIMVSFLKMCEKMCDGKKFTFFKKEKNMKKSLKRSETKQFQIVPNSSMVKFVTISVTYF